MDRLEENPNPHRRKVVALGALAAVCGATVFMAASLSNNLDKPPASLSAEPLREPHVEALRSKHAAAAAAAPAGGEISALITAKTTHFAASGLKHINEVRAKYGEAPIVLKNILSVSSEVVGDGERYDYHLDTSAGPVHFNLIKDEAMNTLPVKIIGCPSPVTVMPAAFYAELAKLEGVPNTCAAPTAAHLAEVPHHPMYFDAEAPFHRGLGLVEDVYAETMPETLVETVEEDGAASAATLPSNYSTYASWPQCVHPALQQGGCGSCYAFAAFTSFAIRQCIADAKEGKVTTVAPITPAQQLSPQSTVNCGGSTHNCQNVNGGSDGCSGGTAMAVFDYLTEYGVKTYAQLPYTAGSAGGYATHMDPKAKVVANQFNTVEGHRAACTDHNGANGVHVKSSNFYYVKGEAAVKAALALHGPMYIALDVYSGGFFGIRTSAGWTEDQVYLGPMAGETYLGGHAVTLLGWGESKGVKYWVIQNSWGPNWGVNGIAKLAMDSKLGTAKAHIWRGVVKTTGGMARAEPDIGVEVKCARVKSVSGSCQLQMDPGCKTYDYTVGIQMSSKKNPGACFQ